MTIKLTKHADSLHQISLVWGAQWLSGRVLVLRLSDWQFKPHRCHYLVSLSKAHKSVLVQSRKTHTHIAEKLLNQIKQKISLGYQILELQTVCQIRNQYSYWSDCFFPWVSITKQLDLSMKCLYWAIFSLYVYMYYIWLYMCLIND